MRIARICICVLVASTAWMPSARAVGADVLLTESCNNHQASVESIRTFHCQVSLSFEPPRAWGRTVTAEYWRIGSNFRCKSQRGIMVLDCVKRDGVTTLSSIDSQHEGDRGRYGHITNRDMPYEGDAWSYGLLSFFGSDRFRVSLKELISSEGTTASAQQMQKEGRRLVRIAVSHSRSDLEIWLDPSVNYLARFVKAKSKGAGNLEGEITVETFQEVLPGIFFPTKVSYVGAKGKSREKSGWVAVFSAIEINQPLADKCLDVRFPPGLLVHDDLRNGVFRTNADGAPVLPAVNAQGQSIVIGNNPAVPTPPRDTPAPDAPAATREPTLDHPLSATEEEPQPWSRWILPVGLVLLLMGCILAVVRRYRTRRVAVGTP